MSNTRLELECSRDLASRIAQMVIMEEGSKLYFRETKQVMSGEELKNTREKLGLSQDDFAACIGGVSQGYICRLEKGNIVVPEDIAEAARNLAQNPDKVTQLLKKAKEQKK